jgi:hypothetical protein
MEDMVPKAARWWTLFIETPGDTTVPILDIQGRD